MTGSEAGDTYTEMLDQERKAIVYEDRPEIAEALILPDGKALASRG